MYELIQAGPRTYYMDCPARVGIYKLNEEEVCLIDAGSDRDAGKKVLRILETNQWKLNCIFSTHSHADHIGGNQFLQERTGCNIFSRGMEKVFSEYPILEPMMLYGGYPCKPLQNKFLLARAANVNELTQDNLPEGMTMLPIDGHSFAMTAFRTEDDVWFLADGISDTAILNKYHVTFLYDVRKSLETLEKISRLEGRLFVPSHGAVFTDVREITEENIKKMWEVCDFLTDSCKGRAGTEDLMQRIFSHYNLKMDMNQYVLVGSTIRSYLAYLQEEKKLEAVFEDNRLYWKTVE